MSWMTRKAEVSDSAVQSTMVLREPIQTTEKWRWKNRDRRYAPLYTAVRLQNTSRRHCMNSQTPTKWHSKPRALRAVEVHPDRKSSSEGKLCGEPSIRYIHVLNWKLSEVAHLQNWAPDVSRWDCICRNCGEEFNRNASKDEYIPRWVCKTETKVSLALKCALSIKARSKTLFVVKCSEQLVGYLHCNIIETQSKKWNTFVFCAL